ncbi:DJ-1/PfpI family protein [Campylobacter concisus]|uniref:DJ-1/PfpI family protein n=1 Tax=Campylobacter concisus TaxID=199 RepID=UPI001CB72471|nr:DJ-1/PfpI family protein [Campylobacter concisus]
MDLFCLIFDDYETLDLMGPVEFLARVPEININYVSFDGGMKRSKQGFLIKTKKLNKMPKESILLLPGGQGTRALVNDSEFILRLKECVLASKFCLSVCTGSALIARTGELNGLKATSNKRSLEWVKSCGLAVKWQERAR